MSVVYTISGAAESWLAKVRPLLAEGAEWQALAVFCEGEQVDPAEINAQAEFVCVPQNGLRGVALMPSEGGHDVRISVMGNSADFALAYRILWEGLSAGNAADCESGEVMAFDTLTAEAAEAMKQSQWDFGLQTLIKTLADTESGIVHLPVAGRQLPVTQADVANPAALEATLTARATRFIEAFPASIIGIAKNGVSINMCNFPGFGTLIPKIAQAITFQDEQGMALEMVPATLFFGSVPVEDAGNCWYVPATDIRADANLFQTLQAAEGQFDPQPPADAGSAVPGGMQIDLTGNNGPGGGGGTGPTEEQWDLLRRAPVIVLMLVAGADGKIDQKELKSFAGIVGGIAQIPPGEEIPPGFDILAAGFTRTLENFEPTMQEVTSMEGGPLGWMLELTNLSEMLDTNLPPEAAINAKIGLFGLGKSIAEASGGFLGLGSKISKQEKAALEMIAATLGLEQ